MKKLFTLCCLFLCSFPSLVQAQTDKKYFIYFKDKANSPYSVSQPAAYLSQAALARRTRQNITVKTRDLPVNPAYVSGIKNTGASVLYKSRWFNGVLVSASPAQLALIQNLPFVNATFATEKTSGATQPDKTEKPANALRLAANRSDYGISYRQAEMIGATQMHDAGFRGEGMTIAVFDAGFPDVNTGLPFAHLFRNNQIKGTYDFVDNDQTVYEKNSHGTMALSCIGAYQLGKYIGTAYKANFYLFITEDVRSEHPVEEFNWLFAAEYADSAGVDIISSSLGYNFFDEPSVSYSYADLNGDKAVSTRAADFAAATGILVVNSAGNEGEDKDWRYIIAPADGDSVLAVGAVDSLGFKASFSSFGPTSDGRIKPNVSAQGRMAAVVTTNGYIGRNNGTSFSCPIISGLAAGLWQANPHLTNMELIDLLQRSGTQASKPDNNLGYGIPNFQRAFQLSYPTDIVVYPNPSEGNNIALAFPKSYWSAPVEINVYDRIGRKVQAFTVPKLNTKGTLNFTLKSNLKSGFYFIQTIQGKQVKSIRFLKL
ncbi:S8 family serine peptidase [Adhaeribacter soli]|uniref:S8 family serine peptidase n=1 Tax=Adhaeribacter soli TaxID=2607655 RepID=A0A5N1IIX0_9BACT|nr:S8 family serine peptidase [Adhaeribacter soli]KAA9325229.1 S8 family serine peptidase [Adhaeribacter soli]